MQRNIARISALAFIFLIWPILVARAEILAIFRCIFGKFKTPQFCSEIIWPLHTYVESKNLHNQTKTAPIM